MWQTLEKELMLYKESAIFKFVQRLNIDFDCFFFYIPSEWKLLFVGATVEYFPADDATFAYILTSN